MLSFVSEIRRGLINTILRYPTNLPPHQDGYVNKFLRDLVVAFVAYDIIEERLSSGNVYPISYNELQNRMSAFLAACPDVMEFRLSTTAW